jgi:predicted O-linked N-acetylglucosamine transferase (SPINDLY family)
VAGSLLTAIDLPELITVSESDYEQLALDLALNPEKLAALKSKLAGNRRSTPLFNTKLFTKHLEEAYQQVYQRYFDGESPDSILILP